MRIYKHLAALLFILFAVEAAYACSCMRPGAPCSYYGKTDAIFLGRVVGGAQQRTVDANGEKTTYDVGTIRFLVQENYKGAPGYEIEIHSGTGGGDCGYWFLRNQSYVVYAYRSTEDNKLYTNICTRTELEADAKEDLEYLRGLAKAKAGATLHGSLRRIIGDPEHGPSEEGPKLAGVKVMITGPGQKIEAVTNQSGEFSVSGLPPGDYDAFPLLPDNLAATSSRDEEDEFGRFTGRRPIKLTDRGCDEISFTVQFSGMVSGKVVQANGDPAKEVQVNLALGEDEEKYWYTWTDKDGRYEFPRVQPGSYLLGFNLSWAPDKDDPYPKTYYPGVKTRSEAALITVGEGEKLKGYDLTLPPRLADRELKVTVVWPDGSPAVNVGVGYEINSEMSTPGERVETNEKGTVVLRLFDNHRYIIHTTAERNGKHFYAKPIDVLVDKNLKPVKFVLNKEGYSFDERDALKIKKPGGV
ncbi:MAG TPA: carboxypeptidase regulatory-like domain-containing protein [Pyrinomonadaceae bacterium]|nr:carboxypeptidase regulatory-like domain-containing protein [Pyrinomonadaceae bacterium]